MKLLKKLYYYDAKSSSQSMFRFAELVKTLCAQRGANVEQDAFGNIYVTKGNAKTYPCIASHLDEVHGPRGNNFRVVVENGNIIKGYDDYDKKLRHGIGADDKNGIWVALRCLETTRAIKLAFFVDEEIGCRGSERANMEFFSNVRFVLQIDRKNNCDFITDISGVELCDSEFINDVQPERWGYAVTDGLSTDVCELKCNGLSVACCNMSCGYYNPHTANEFTYFADLKKCLRFVKHIIRDCKRVYHHEYIDRYDRYGRYGYYGGGYGRSFYDDDFDWGIPSKKSDIKTAKTSDKKSVEPTADADEIRRNNIEDLIVEGVDDFGLYDRHDIYEEVVFIIPGVTFHEFNEIYDNKYPDDTIFSFYLEMIYDMEARIPSSVNTYDLVLQAISREFRYVDEEALHLAYDVFVKSALTEAFEEPSFNIMS